MKQDHAHLHKAIAKIAADMSAIREEMKCFFHMIAGLPSSQLSQVAHSDVSHISATQSQDHGHQSE